MTSTVALPWKTAWVTGASTGIGRELVIQLAAAGVKVAATARSADKLTSLAESTPGIAIFPGDVTDAAAMQALHARIVATMGEIDLAVLNAGIWDQASAKTFSTARAAATMAVNYAGLANALEPLIAAMLPRRSGHIALVSSVAGYRGLPKGIYYGPSKSAAIALAEVMECELAPHGLTISVINPGFVETPMTAVNEFPMPYLLKADDAASRIIRGLAKRKFEIAFPWQMVAMLKLARVLPYPAYFWMIRNFVARAAEGESAPAKPGDGSP